VQQTPYPKNADKDEADRRSEKVAVHSEISAFRLRLRIVMTRNLSLAVLAGMFVCTVLAAEPVSRRDAARLQAKLDRIT
jgi:hypothetical protein